MGFEPAISRLSKQVALTMLTTAPRVRYARPKEVVHIFLWVQSVTKPFSFSNSQGYVAWRGGEGGNMGITGL